MATSVLHYSATSCNNETGKERFNDTVKEELKPAGAPFPHWTTGVCFTPHCHQLIFIYYGSVQLASQGELFAIISHYTDRKPRARNWQ